MVLAIPFMSKSLEESKQHYYDADACISRGYCLYIAFWYSSEYHTDLTEP